MWLLMLCLFWGDDGENYEPDPINAQLILANGDRIELVDVRIRGQDAYSFNFHEENGYTFINLLRVKRITRLDASRYELLMDDGSKRVGDIQGKGSDEKAELQTHNIRAVDRIHIVSGAQLRSCLQDHYEERTPHPYCPVCGNLLQFGPFDKHGEAPQIAVPRHHLLRSDPRGDQ